MNAVLVVVTRQMGDVLLTVPLLQALRARWPQARIDVLGFAGTLGLLEGHPAVDRLLPVPARAGLGPSLALVRSLWRRWDLALVADAGDHAHLLGWLAAPLRAGILPRRHPSNWWKRRALRHVVWSAGDLDARHVVPEKLALLAPWCDGGTPAPAITAAPGSPLPAALVQRLAPGYVVVQAPSMWPYKQWPLAHFRTLVAQLAQAGRQVVLTGGPGADDRATVDALADAAPHGQVLDAGVLGLRQLATLLRGAALYIGPDTSISHLAAACGTPVLALFGPTNPQRWAPWPADTGSGVGFARRAPLQRAGNVTVLQAELPCVPCGKAGCEDHRQSATRCLPAIPPERVLAQAMALLDAQRPSGATAGGGAG